MVMTTDLAAIHKWLYAFLANCFYIHMDNYVVKCPHIHTSTHAHAHTHIHTHAHTHTHTHMQTHIYIYTQYEPTQ